MAQSLDSLGLPWEQTSLYKKLAAREQLKTLASKRGRLSLDEQAYFDYSNHDRMVELAATAEMDVDVPQGRPNPQWEIDLRARVLELNESLSDESLTDEEKNDIRQQMQDLTEQADALKAAAQGGN